jgi:hypothetical protein
VISGEVGYITVGRVETLTATIGHPDMNAFHSAVAAARTVADLEEVVQGAIDPRI